jgi:hypothetical protein
MDSNIVSTVYNTLAARTTEIGKVVSELNKLDEKIKSNRYSPQALKSDIYPERDRLSQKVQTMRDDALSEARGLVAQYRADAAELNRLDPAQLTDDVKLLQPGIILSSEDIQGMLKRNSGNRTMIQVILRYAEERGISTDGTFFTGGEEGQTADNLDGIIKYYEHWILEDDALDMLEKFFHA